MRELSMNNGKSDGVKAVKKVAKVDRLTALVERHFRGEFTEVLKSKDLGTKGLLLWAIEKYAAGNCGVAYVHDSLKRPHKIFYKWDSKRRLRFIDTQADFVAFGLSYYLENNSKE